MFSARGLALVALLLPALACADLKDIVSLQHGLAREFQTSAINVNLNNSAYLTITFANSPVADLPEPEQAAFARRVAEYVRDHYPRFDQLRNVRVGFSTVKGVGIQLTTTRIPYEFTPDQLGAPQHPKNAVKQADRGS